MGRRENKKFKIFEKKRKPEMGTYERKNEVYARKKHHFISYLHIRPINGTFNTN